MREQVLQPEARERRLEADAVEQVPGEGAGAQQRQRQRADARRAECVRDARAEVADLERLVVGDVEDAAAHLGLRGAGERLDLVDDVADEAVGALDPAPPRVEVAPLRDRGEEVAVGRREPGAPDRRRAHDRPREAVAVAADDLLAFRLAPPVRGRRPEVAVVAREVAEFADEHRGRQQDARDALGRLDEVAHAGGVGVVVARAAPLQVGARREMDEQVRREPLDRRPERVAIADVGGTPVGGVGRVARRRDVDVEHAVAARERAREQVGADEARPAGDEDSLHRIVSPLFRRSA